jgi:4-hydroxy-tetrahydrodipicolinate reductase
MSPTVAVHGATGRLGRLVVAEAGASFAGAIGRTGPIPSCDVVIDVSTPEGLAGLLPRLDGQPLVVGTTGALPDLDGYAARAPVLITANFSAGIPILLDLVKEAVERLPPGWDIEVVEVHHNQKRDAPSGTAKRLIEAIGTAVPTHSLRVGDAFGTHTIVLAGPGERLELTHVATRREVFAIGALRAAQWIVGQRPGLYRR